MRQISYPPANGASLGSYFCVKIDFSQKTLSKSGLYIALQYFNFYKSHITLGYCFMQKSDFLSQIRPKKNFSPFCFASPEIIWVEFGNRQTNRQKNKFFDTIYGGMWIFLFSYICYLPTHFAHRVIKGIIRRALNTKGS